MRLRLSNHCLSLSRLTGNGAARRANDHAANIMPASGLVTLFAGRADTLPANPHAIDAGPQRSPRLTR